MKKILNHISTLIFTLLFANNANAGQNTFKQPVFRGTVKLVNGKPSGNDSLSVSYLKPYQPLGIPENRLGSDYYLITDKNGEFRFTLPAFEEPIMMTLKLVYFGGFRSNSDVPDRVTLIGTFLVERDDDIAISIVKTGKHETDYFTFSGKGVEKYNVSQQLGDLMGSNLSSGEHWEALHKIFQLNGKLDTSDYEGRISRYCEITSSLLEKKAAILERSGMSPKMKKLYAYNFAPIYDSWVFHMYHIYRKLSSNPTLQLKIKEIIEKNRVRLHSPSDPSMALAPMYPMRLASSEYYLSQINTENTKLEYQDMYHVIKNKFSGPLRELLIANFFMKGYGWKGTEALSPTLVDSLMRDGKQYLHIPIIKDAYATKLKLTTGMPVFNGEFKDAEGSHIDLSSLKGKVVFIDFWFTGCGACMTFHQNFHQKGYPSLKENKDFVYVSISIDKQKATWLKSISGGQYTSNDYLNLNAESGTDDPFLKYYQRNALPFLLLLDKNGKIYSTSIVPEPKAVVQLINEALNIPYKPI